jgi:ABC-type branched-subunit amino acid transport system substrate-binding protein
VDALLLAGDATCARDAVTEARAAGLHPRLGLGPGCAELLRALAPTLPTFAVAFGAFPLYQDEAAPVSMRQWSELTGSPPTWYHVLGHDAAVLAAQALGSFPLDVVDDAREVAELHRRALDELAQARAVLWSSHAHGFGGRRALERQPRLIGPAPNQKSGP